MNNDGKYKYLVNNTLLFAVSSFGTKIMTFLLVPLYTNILSTSDYGIADVISTTVGLLIYILTLNISSAVLRFAIRDSENKERYLKFGLKILSIGFVLLFFVVLVVWLLKIIDCPNYCFVLFLFIYIATVSNDLFSNYLRAINKIKSVAIAGVLITMSTISFNILFLVIFKWGLYGYLLSLFLGQFISCVYCIIVINPICVISSNKSIDKKTKINMLVFSIPLIFNGVGWWINLNLDKYFIIWLLGVAENGIYSVASKIPAILSSVSGIFSQAWLLSAIKEYDEEDDERFFTNIFSVYNLVVIGISYILICFNDVISRFMYGVEFIQAKEYTCILVVATAFSCLSGFLGSIYSAMIKTKIIAYSTIFSALVNFALNCVLIPQYKLYGAAFATLVSFFAIYLQRLFFLDGHKELKRKGIKYLLADGLLIMQVIIREKINISSNIYWQLLFIPIYILILKKEIKFLAQIICNIIKERLAMKRQS